MDLIVTPAVLIPRPETEHVIETVLELAGARNAGASKSSSSLEKLRIVDVGTGSGCIALALAKELPQAEILAHDISPEALEVARSNAARLQLDARIQKLVDQFAGSILRVRGHNHAAGLENAVERDDKLGDVWHEQPHTIALLDADTGQAGRHAVGEVIHFMIADDPSLEDRARMIRVFSRCLLQERK